MEVLRPKELDTHPGEKIIPWARGQLENEINRNGWLAAILVVGRIPEHLARSYR